MHLLSWLEKAEKLHNMWFRYRQFNVNIFYYYASGKIFSKTCTITYEIKHGILWITRFLSETVVDPSLRPCCWWRVSRWRYCDAIMYCDFILTNCPRSALRSERAFFCRRQVDYHSLIIDSGSWRYHRLAYKDYVLWQFIFVFIFQIHDKILRNACCISMYCT